MKRSLIRLGFHLVLTAIFVAVPRSWGSASADDRPADAADAAATSTNAVTSKKSATIERTIGKKSVAPATPISAEREAEVIEFAQQNHPELVSLLQNIKQSAPKEYQVAMAELDRTVDRLSKAKARSRYRYDSQLTDWKLTSRAQLLAARLAVSSDSSAESDLRAMLRQRLESRLNAQRAERDRMQSRLEKMDQTIAEAAARLDAEVDKQFSELRKTPSAPKATSRARTKRAAADPVDAKEQK